MIFTGWTPQSERLYYMNGQLENYSGSVIIKLDSKIISNGLLRCRFNYGGKYWYGRAYADDGPVTILRLKPPKPSKANKDKTHCLRGHEFSGENMRVTKEGSRKCRKCRNMQSNARYKRLKGKL